LHDWGLLFGSVCSNLDVKSSMNASLILSLGHRLFAGAEEDSSAADPQEREAVEAAVAAQAGTRERPPPWIDVTTALQFMADDGSLVFHAVSAEVPPLRSSLHPRLAKRRARISCLKSWYGSTVIGAKGERQHKKCLTLRPIKAGGAVAQQESVFQCWCRCLRVD